MCSMEAFEPEQRTTTWLEWRKLGIGASEAPALMGVSPWATALDVFNDKLGLVKKDFSNFATQRGNDLEPIARALFELEQGFEAPAALMTHPKYAYIRASLDGWNTELRRVLEIKCPGKPDHELAINGKVPEKYYPQLQHQMLVTGADQAYYFSYHPDHAQKTATIIVPADKAYQAKLLAVIIEFWNERVLKGVPPELTDQDVRVITDAKEVHQFAKLRTLIEQADQLDEQIKGLKDEITKQYTDRAVEAAGVRMTRITKKGAVDWAKVPKAIGVDVEQYRKKSTTYTQFTLLGSEEEKEAA